PCAKYLRDDKYALRVCILYESLNYQKDKSNVPVFEVFVNFCKVIGDEDVLKYPEFEFWFYRFLNENFDLNYERDEEKKFYELMDMPIDIMKNIVEYLDIFDRASLVRTSRSLQTFVEDQKLFHHILKLIVDDDITTISFDKSDNIQYTWEDVDCQESLHHWEQALLVLKSILKNPKLHLDILEIELDVDNKNVFNGLEDALKFTHHLNVKNLILEKFSTDLLMKVLSTLKPGHLTTITMLSYNPNPDSMDTVFEMEQWKRAECFSMDGNFIWPLRHLYHFVYFHVFLIEVSVEDVRQMKKILFKSPNFGQCLIIVDDLTVANAIEEEFGDYIQQREIYSEYMKIYHYPIPNSSEFFEIYVDGSMSNFLKSNQIALRPCLLYEFLQGKQFLKSFYDFCDTVGNDLITRKEFDTWFRRFAKGRFYKRNNKKQRPISKMTEILRSDPKALRTCILYEFLSTNRKEQTIEEMFMRLYLNQSPGYLIFTKYKNFCKVIGYDVMEYPEFEFWFYRFSNGEFDLDFEMEKNQKTLLDMPIVAMEKIVENLDIFDRLLLSKTCHSLRIFTRSQKLFHHTLSLHIYDDRSRISFGCLVGDSIQYTGTTRKFKNKEDKFKGTHWEQAVQDFNEIVHSYPKLHLGVLQITSQNRLNGARFKGATQLHVNSLILEASTQSIDIFPRILRVLKPGYLETITVYSDSLKKSVMRKVVEMDQWKEAKYLIMNEAPFPGTIRDLFHFKQFHVHCEELSVEDMREMKEILFNSPGFEKCTISLDISIDFAAVREEFGDAIHGHTHKYQILNSRDYFELKIFEFEIRVARKIEFDLWYYRFLNGEYDVNYEIDKDKKTYELSDMPLDVMGKIVENLNIFDRLALSKTSRSFRTFIKDQKLPFYDVTFYANKDSAGIRISSYNLYETTIKYEAKGDDYIKRFRESDKIIKGVPHWKQALMDFNNILKFSKLEVNQLSIYWDVDTTFHQPSDVHDSEISWDFTHKLSVKEFHIDSPSLEPLLTILPSLKPGYLESIYDHMNDPKRDDWEKIVNMEQWKQAKHFYHSGNPLDIPIRHFHHFRRFRAFVCKASVEEVRQMKELLFTSSDFERCSIIIDNFIDSFDERTLDELFGNAIETTPERTYHCPIPDSTDYFEITIDGRDIDIDRIRISESNSSER
ncbi:unnamed protein product, partial [Caenorhabditis brenneri]